MVVVVVVSPFVFYVMQNFWGCFLFVDTTEYYTTTITGEAKKNPSTAAMVSNQGLLWFFALLPFSISIQSFSLLVLYFFSLNR